MEIIKVNVTNCYLNQTELSSKNKKQSEIITPPKFDKNFKIVDYLDFVYSYPPKVKIKWDNIDNLKHDFFCRINSDVYSRLGYFDSPSRFSELDENLRSQIIETPEKAVHENYTMSEYFGGFLNKVNSSNFFQKKTKEIQSALVNIPVFVVLNGQGEIILNKPSNILGSQNIRTYLNEKFYDWCGGFDLAVEKKPKFGCFFFNFVDAEQYLKEVARFDIEGTETVGLSIHCTNLGSAYKITREYHPGIDFRFVPHFDEVKNLLKNNSFSLTPFNNKSSIVFEDEQQQFRLRPKNFTPGSKYIGTEYFKGVPIYIVQLFEHRNNVLQESDNIVSNSGELKKYIFFEKQQAVKFCKKNGRKIVSHSNKGINFMLRKPTILVYNFEDFIEDWEDNLILEANASGNEKLSTVNFFVSPTENVEKIKSFSNSEAIQFPIVNNVANYLTVNYKVLKRAIGIFFSV